MYALCEMNVLDCYIDMYECVFVEVGVCIFGYRLLSSLSVSQLWETTMHYRKRAMFQC